MTTLIQTEAPVKPVVYDRSQRAYNVYCPKTGELVDTFPSGREGKRAAFQMSVQLQNPQLHTLATQWCEMYPELQARVWRAAEIVLDDGVLPAFSMQHLAVISSQNSAHGEYNVAMRDQMLQCDCEDFVSFSAPMIGENSQLLCKHLLAYVLFTQLNTNSVM